MTLQPSPCLDPERSLDAGLAQFHQKLLLLTTPGTFLYPEIPVHTLYKYVRSRLARETGNGLE